jgi:transcriptional regulator with XRE-family HTH domain
VGTPLGEFIRAKRDRTHPADLGIPGQARRRAPGLRRTELAARAGISVEYLTRIEQGRDRNPSGSVVNAIADALGLDPAERRHLVYLAKISGGACAGPHHREPPRRQVRPEVLQVLHLLEPAPAIITNRLGDILACTAGFRAVMGATGLLETEPASLTRYVFTDPRARDTFPDWDHVADEHAFSLWLGPSVASYEWFTAELAPIAGPEFTRRLRQRLPPPRRQLRMRHPAVEHDLRWHRETLELPAPDEQQLVIYLPADQQTAHALGRLGDGAVPLAAGLTSAGRWAEPAMARYVAIGSATIVSDGEG